MALAYVAILVAAPSTVTISALEGRRGSPVESAVTFVAPVSRAAEKAVEPNQLARWSRNSSASCGGARPW